MLGLDPGGPDDSLIEFAFDAAARRSAVLRVVHGWNLPPYYTYGLSVDPEYHDEIVRQQSAALSAALRPWRQKHPDIEVVEESRSGSGANHLVDASREASLVVVGLPDPPQPPRRPHRLRHPRRPAPRHRPSRGRVPQVTSVNEERQA